MIVWNLDFYLRVANSDYDCYSFRNLSSFQAQRQWKKLHEKAESAKKAYYNACRQARSAGVLLANANSDTSMSADNAAKLKVCK